MDDAAKVKNGADAACACWRGARTVDRVTQNRGTFTANLRVKKGEAPAHGRGFVGPTAACR
jgi:hypothetical protein